LRKYQKLWYCEGTSGTDVSK